jgi:Cys-tRNA(Pro)/Cys-tRNA(Cys) deacylase
MVFKKIQSLLESGGLPFTLHTHPAVSTIEDAEEKVPHLTKNLLKTIVFKIKDGDWILAVVKGHDRIDYKELARAFNVNRRDIRTVSPDRVKNQLGFEVGGIGPFPVNDTIKIIMDQALTEIGMIFCGSGKNTVTIEMDISDLIKLVDPVIWKIKKG